MDRCRDKTPGSKLRLGIRVEIPAQWEGVTAGAGKVQCITFNQGLNTATDFKLILFFLVFRCQS